MSTVFFISDTHFHHKNVIHFKRDDGELLRRIQGEHHVRGFYSVEEMDEYMVAKWNSVVHPHDKVYHLGDFDLGKNPGIAARLNGHKRLVRGNHDGHRLREYAVHFEEIYGVRHLPGCVMSHVPLHPGCLGRWGVNLHGHLHYNEVRYDPIEYGVDEPDHRYFNCSVERLDYTPISVEELRQRTGAKILC